MDDEENRPKWAPYARTYDPLQSGSIDGTDTVPHDRALCRAMEAKYVPPNHNIASPNAAKTLFVGRLDFKTTDESLKEEFSRYGTVTHCRVVRDVVTGFSRGYAFVQFKHHENADLARREAHHVVLEGREILVEWENGRTMPGWIPRRLGGGFGGKKGSGQLRFGGRDRPFRKPIIIKPMKRDGSSNREEGDGRKDVLQERIRRLTAEDEEREERQSSRTDNWSESRGCRSSQLTKGSFSKPWNRRNREGWNNSNDRDRESGPSWKGPKDWYKGEDWRWAEKSLREGSSSSRDRRYSSTSSRNWKGGEERGSSYQGRSEGRFRRSQDREDTSDREDHYGMERRNNASKFSRESAHHQKLEVHEERSRMSKDREDLNESEVTYKERRMRRKRSRRSCDREDSDDFGDGKVVKAEEHPGRLLKDRDDGCEWKSFEISTPERSDKETNRSRKSCKEEDVDTRENSYTKRSRKSSRDRCDTEADDDFERTKKKKKHSKKSSRDSESDDSYERKRDKKKKKKKHKKSRD